MPYESFIREEDYLQSRADEYIWQRAKELGVSRRRFFQILAAGGAVAALSGRSSSRAWAAQTAPTPVLKPTPKELFNDFGSNKEMRWENMYERGYLVPNELFFVRNHTRTPSVDVQKWRLKIEGSGVQKPMELTYDEILSMPSVSVIRYVECAGNGRSFFSTVQGKKADGTQWKLGAIGVAEWTGVPMSEVLNRAGTQEKRYGCNAGRIGRSQSPATDACSEGARGRYLAGLRDERATPTARPRVSNSRPSTRLDRCCQYQMGGKDRDFREAAILQLEHRYLCSYRAGLQAGTPFEGSVLSNQDLKSALELPWGGRD